MDVFEKILLAVDGSDYSKKAIPVAIELASKSKGEVVVVHVIVHLVYRETVDLETQDEARLLADAVVDLVTKAGVRARRELRAAGHLGVAKEILDVAKSHGADTIVLGSRGLGDIEGLLLGSVAHKVIQLADCTVVVAR
jgi:nucleotide-binding universal stress UspA family protein